MEDEKKISGIVKVEPKPSNGFTSKVIDLLEKLVVKFMYDSSLPHHYLAGNFAPIPDETPPTKDLPVRGCLPDCLNGEFVRVGPNPKFPPVAGYHWFDGDGVRHLYHTNQFTVTSKQDLEWKLIYVGSAEDETYDQLLESVLVGPVNVGNYRIVLQADPPDPSKIREEDIIGVTVLLLICSYLGQEFIRVGYYVNNDYDDEQLREEPPPKVLIDRVQRNILSDKPRVKHQFPP